MIATPPRAITVLITEKVRKFLDIADFGGAGGIGGSGGAGAVTI